MLDGRDMDGRVKRNGKQCNFFVFYEVDDELVATVLCLEDYGSEAESGWVLLEKADGDAPVV